MDEDGDGDDDAAEGAGGGEEVDMDPSPQKPAPPSALPATVAPLLALIQPTPLSFPPTAGAPSPHPPTTSALSALHICALECLNNVFLSLATPARLESRGFASDADSAAGPGIWDAVWRALAAVGTDVDGPGQERRREVWQTAVGVLWGVAILWKGILVRRPTLVRPRSAQPADTHPILQVPQVEQVNVLIQLYTAASEPAVQVKCIGTLECLAQHPASIDGNRVSAAFAPSLAVRNADGCASRLQVISQFLISLLARPADVPTEPLLQAVSALIDIYSDETAPYDVVFREGGYLQALVAAVEPVRRVVRGIDRKRERDLRRRGEEVRDNLVAFIEYRRALRL